MARVRNLTSGIFIRIEKLKNLFIQNKIARSERSNNEVVAQMEAFGLDSCSVNSWSMGLNPGTGSYETLHMADDYGYGIYI